MSLSSYSRHAFHVGEELRQMLRAEAYEPLLEQLSSRTIRDLVAFERAEGALIEKVATSAPAARQKLLDKLPLEKQFWTIAVAAQMAFEAAAVLDAAELELRPGGSYRAMIGAVQTVLQAPHLSEDYLWPFPSDPPEGLFD